MTYTPNSLSRCMWVMPWCLVLSGCVGVGPLSPKKSSSHPSRVMSGSIQRTDGAEQYRSESPEHAQVALELKALPVHPKLTERVLSNGLTVLALDRGRPESKVLMWLVVRAGSRHETQADRGSARVLQHLAFGGDEALPKDVIDAWFSKRGSRADPDLHGYTSHDETVYQLQVAANDDDALISGLKILRHWAAEMSVSQPLVRAAMKSLGKTQYRQDHPAAQAAAVHKKAVLKGCSYAPKGPVANLPKGSISREQVVRRYYERWYRPDNAALIVVGPVRAKQTIERIEESFGSWRSPNAPLTKIRDDTSLKSAQLRVSRYANKALQSNRISLILSRRAEIVSHRAAYAQTLRRRMSIRMLNLRLQAVSKQRRFGAGQVGAFHRRWVKSIQATVLSASGQVSQLPERIALINRELERISRHGFTPQQIGDAKAWVLARIRSEATRRHTIANRRLAHALVRHATRADAMMSLEQELKLCEEIVPNITAQELRDTVNAWANRSDRLVTLSCRNCDDGLSDRVLARSATWPKDRPLSPWVDGPPDAELLWNLPTPGTIISRNHLAAANLFRWQLSNGAEVVLKTTPGSTTAIRFEAIAPGGWSLGSTEHIASAKASASLANACGLGAWSADQLRKRLKKSDVVVKFRLSHLDHGLRGHAPAKHIATLLEAVHLHFGPLRKDPDAQLIWRKNREAQIQRRGLRWRARLYDQVRAMLYQGHPKGRVPSLRELAEVDSSDALKFLRARFQQANGFRFIVVGDLDPRRFEALLRIYIASLPSGAADQRRDDGLKIHARGKLTLSSTQVKRATRIVYFSQPSAWTSTKANHLKELARALGDWLPSVVEISPKDLKVSASFERWPTGHFKLAIELRCAAADLETTTSSLLRALQLVRQQGISPRHSSKLSVSTSLQSRSISKRSQSIDALRWRRRLARGHLAKTPLSALAPKRLVVASNTDLQAIAKLALTPESFLTVTLLPK